MDFGFEANQDLETQKIFRSKEINNEIMTSIKKVRQKLAIDASTKQNLDTQQKYQISSRSKSNFIDKTISILKNKITELQKQKVQLQNDMKKNSQNQMIEIQNLKAQLSKFIERQFEAEIQQNLSPNEIKFQVLGLKDRLKKCELENDLLKSKLKMSEQNYSKLEKNITKITNEYSELQKQKERHIQLNIIDKLKFEEQMTEIYNEKQKKNNLIKKLEQQNINLKREIHGIFNKDRFTKQNNLLEKKSQDQYEFEIKELTQKFNIKIKNQEKQLNFLKKTLEKLKDKNSQSDINLLNQYELDIEALKEKLIQKDKRLNLKIIQNEKLTATVENQTKIIQDKENQLKSLIDILNKKENLQSQLTNKLLKNGIPINEYKQTSKSLRKQCSQIISDITFEKQEIQTEKEIQKSSTRKTILRSNYASLELEDQRKKPIMNEIIAQQQRALAGLKSNYKKINNKQLSLKELMTEIRRKTDKINDLRSQKNQVQN